MQKVLSLEWRVVRRSLTLLQMSVSSASLGQRPRMCPICFVSLGWRLRTCCICCCVAGRRGRLALSSQAQNVVDGSKLETQGLVSVIASSLTGQRFRRTWSAAVLSWILNGCWSAIVSPLQAGDSELDLLVSLPFRDSDSEQCPLTSFPLLHSDSERRCFC